MFGDKEFDNVGYPTPETIPSECAYRLAKLPSSAAWLGVFMGLLETLLDEQNWQQFEGGISREDAARVWADIIDDMYNSAEAGIILDVRQNPTSPCLLEKTFDGTTWVTFADLTACPSGLRRLANGRYQTGSDAFGWFDASEGPATTNIWDNFTPTVPMSLQNNDKCTAAANAAYAVQRLYRAMGTTLMSNVDSVIAQVIDAAGAVLGSLFGIAVAPELFATVIPAIVVIQGLYAITDMSDADFHDLACIFYRNMSGTSGHWTEDVAGVTAEINGRAASNPIPWLLIRELLVFIGQTGVELAFKTTTIGSFDCTSGLSVTLLASLKSYQQRLNNDQWSLDYGAPIPQQWMLMRKRFLSTFVNNTTYMVDQAITHVAPYVDINSANAGVPGWNLYNLQKDVWVYNDGQMTLATATAAIRSILGNPAATPVVGAIGVAANPNFAPAGSFLYTGFRDFQFTQVYTPTVQVDYYVGKVFAAC